MTITKRSLYIIVVSIYLLVLFCGVGSIISNELLDSIRTNLQLFLPLLITTSTLWDQRHNIKNIDDKKGIILISLNIIWFIITILLGINIGSQSIKGLVNFVNILILLYMISHINFNKEEKAMITKAFIVSTFIATIYGIIQYLFQINLNIFENAKYPGIFGRINSTFYLPTLYDKYMVVIFGIVSCNLLKEDKIINRILFILTGLNVILTFSRGGFIGLMLVLVIFIIYSIIKKLWKNLLMT